jgi:hypothetical protein
VGGDQEINQQQAQADSDGSDCREEKEEAAPERL